MCAIRIFTLQSIQDVDQTYRGETFPCVPYVSVHYSLYGVLTKPIEGRHSHVCRTYLYTTVIQDVDQTYRGETFPCVPYVSLHYSLYRVLTKPIEGVMPLCTVRTLILQAIH